MRNHHGYGCYGPGWHWGCGSDYGWGPGPDYGWDLDAPLDYPRTYRRGMRFGGRVAPRRTTLSQLEGYLASLQEEIRAVEQDIRDLGDQETGSGEEQGRETRRQRQGESRR
jgi:hypothetical protein